MEYQVPQFIEVEDKIFGPFTLKQFIYIAGGIGLSAILVFTLPLMLGIILAIPVLAFALALAFYKINNKPFVEIIEAGFNYYIGKRLYIWRKEKDALPEATKVVPEAQAPHEKLGLSQTKLQELAWSLDVRDTGKGDEPA
jgi:hypothetical protein